GSGLWTMNSKISRADSEGTRAESVYRVENVSDTPRTNYLMDSEEQLGTIDELEDDGYEVVGFYHSHPEGPDYPSTTDEERANWPDHSYVIVSLGGEEPYVGSWRWTGEEFEREAVSLGRGEA
ncbi:MAG: M67 family metallopeptidase, partial [Halobacteria archaeon]|nr:M67 family metallopeptidase [Halobacteria archaeon]